MKNTLIFIIAIVLATAAGYLTQKYFDKPGNNSASQEIGKVIGTPRPEFAVADINGVIRNIKDWDGKVILLNFWATWCPPCLKEIPAFIALQNEYGERGLQIVGVAMDNEEAVRRFNDKLPMNYPVIAGDMETIELARRYGNTIGALPYTVIIDREGIIRATFAGELSKARALQAVMNAGL